MNLGKRAYWVVALVAILALAGAAVTLTSRMTAAGGGDTPAATQDCQDQGDGGAEAKDAADTDAIEQECGPDDGDANEAESADDGDANEVEQAGKLDDGADLLPQAGITVDEAITAAQAAVTGDLGEIDLEQYHGTLVFNVDVGDKDVKVDASNGTVLATDTSD